MSIGTQSDPETTSTVIGLLKRLQTLGRRTTSLTPGNQASVDAFAEVAGSRIDTSTDGALHIAYRLAEVGGANGVTYKVQGSMVDAPGGGGGSADWIDLTTLDELGAERAAVEIAVAAGTSALAMVTPHFDAGAKAALRHFRAVVRSTVAAAAGQAQVRALAK